MEKANWKKYFAAFIITAAIFGTAAFTSNYFNQRRIDDIKAAQNAVATNIMSSETEIALLSDIPCEEAGSSMLSSELNDLAEKISYSEESIGRENEDVIALKKTYSLLEIKDYLLMKSIASRCGKKFGFALYFYGDKASCPDCDKAGFVLTYLRRKYPELRVYSFDYNLDLSAVQTLIKIRGIKDELPAIVIDREVVNGFIEKEALEEKILSHYPKLSIATSTETVEK